MKTWKYKLLKCGGYSGNPFSIERWCNELGAEGWELVGTSPVLDKRAENSANEWLMIFKRAEEDQ